MRKMITNQHKGDDVRKKTSTKKGKEMQPITAFPFKGQALLCVFVCISDCDVIT